VADRAKVSAAMRLGGSLPADNIYSEYNQYQRECLPKPEKLRRMDRMLTRSTSQSIKPGVNHAERSADTGSILAARRDGSTANVRFKMIATMATMNIRR
jgi:hypothetical protein